VPFLLEVCFTVSLIFQLWPKRCIERFEPQKCCCKILPNDRFIPEIGFLRLKSMFWVCNRRPKHALKHLCLQSHALWTMQCTCHFSEMYDVDLLKHGGIFFWRHLWMTFLFLGPLLINVSIIFQLCFSVAKKLT
jgi:hypothetical protein